MIESDAIDLQSNYTPDANTTLLLDTTTNEVDRAVNVESNEVIARATNEVFKCGSVYDSFRIFRQAVDDFAIKHYFQVARGGNKLHCWRGHASGAKERDRSTEGVANRNRNSVLNCDCKWSLTYAFCEHDGQKAR